MRTTHTKASHAFKHIYVNLVEGFVTLVVTAMASATRALVLDLAEMIKSAARTAISLRWCCRNFADHMGLVETFLERFVVTGLARLPEMMAEIDGLEEALRRAAELVESCSQKSYLYMVAVGWDAVYQFRQLQTEIDGRVKTVGVNPLVTEFQMEDLKEALKVVQEDHREYSLEEEEIAAQVGILKPDRTEQDADAIENALTRAYADLSFQDILDVEKSKLQIELAKSEDAGHLRLIEHLIGVTESTSNDKLSRKVRKLMVNEPAFIISGYISNASTLNQSISWKVVKPQGGDEWRANLFDCCAEPCLSLKAFIYPCGLFSLIANIVSRGKISRESAISDFLSYSIFCGCCCYSCCMRRKLRELFNIEGGACDDFTAHLMCFCCALVQEHRELQIRGFEGCQGRKMVPPPYQSMNL
ncbi:hypothetical protein SAY87_018546 [Trapa incisa]|uniref:MCAfunc domain-containing protein n=1 Tax=Trapa incisa TaxID=236973 RepID=A0AAN7L5K7_9MYRT|nr:hypothetical protein SAY87_018546 [Trapa incisa]